MLGTAAKLSHGASDWGGGGMCALQHCGDTAPTRRMVTRGVGDMQVETSGGEL